MKKRIPHFFLFWSLSCLGFQPVDINHASVEQIAILPGVGKSLASAIVRYRSQKGSLASPEELRTIQGMTEKKIALIEKYIIFSPSSLKPHKHITSLKSAQQPTLIRRQRKTMMGLAQLESKVLQIAGLEREFETEMAHRARTSAWLPKITIEGDIDRHGAKTETISESKDVSSQRLGNIFGIGIKANFDIPQVMFHSVELDIHKLALKRLEMREKLLGQLHNYYFEYARLNQEITVLSSAEKIAQLEDELNKYAAKLDSLSAGEFSRFQVSAS